MDFSDILISESQERMLIICNDDNLKQIKDIFTYWDLEYSIIGKVTNTGKYQLYNYDKLLYTKNIHAFDDVNDNINIPNIKHKYSQSDDSESETIHCTEKWQVYDSTVGNRTIKGPDKPGSYAILDIYEVKKQLIITWGESFDECYDIMKLFEQVKPLSVINCLNYGDPKTCLYDLKETIDDLTLKCKKHKIPVVGGNVSLYNSTDDKSIKPTPIIVMLGITY